MVAPRVSDQATTQTEPIPCSPCRGTGKVISGAGGESRPVDCPWCEGTGVRKGEIDAQARHRDAVDG